MACSVVHPKTGITYYLHSKLARYSKNRMFYYFSKEIVDAVDLPDGYEVGHAKLSGHGGNGMLFLRKKKKIF